MHTLNYQQFWQWFTANEQEFFQIVKNDKNVDEGFLDKLAPKLEDLKEGFFFVTGMLDKQTAELILTADGRIENIVFVEELVDAAPEIPHWKFTALKPELAIEDVTIKMAGFTFNQNNLFFYTKEYSDYPDYIEINIVYQDYREKQKETIINGIYIFIDNYLGELRAIHAIDSLRVIPKEEAEKELIPIAKLKAYLIWREKEFIEKYGNISYSTDNDEYVSLTADLEDGNQIIAILNASLFSWNGRASHPWLLTAKVTYEGSARNGMPNKPTYQSLNEFEDELMLYLEEKDGCLNVGRQTGNNTREIYIACKDFRVPAKVMHAITEKYTDKLDVDFDIEKDKYWIALRRFGLG